MAGRRSASVSARVPIQPRCGRRAATTIAFTKQAEDKFAIGIMRADGQGERILTAGYHNEGPTFAPNGRVLMFFRDPGGNSGRRSIPSTSPAATNSGQDAELCFRPGLVAAVAVGSMRTGRGHNLRHP